MMICEDVEGQHSQILFISTGVLCSRTELSLKAQTLYTLW